MLHRPVEPKKFLSIVYTDRIGELGARPSTGTVGDSFDNALAEAVNGLYKTELVKRQRPWKGFDDLEIATAEWVDWFNCETAQASAGQGLTPGYN